MADPQGRVRLQPAQVLVLGFALAIAAGTLLLSLPMMWAAGERHDVLTALFTATSAVCVTGLTVVDTGTAWSVWGQAVILGLIKIGGLGIMTLGTLVALALGRKIGLKDRLAIQAATGALSLQGMVRLVRYIIVFSLVFEGLGAALFTLRFLADFPPPTALAMGVFHSLSAFNNAGFSLFADSLQRYVGDPMINIVAVLLIISGGLGFFVMVDLWRAATTRARLTLHTRVVLRLTGGLILFGMVMVLLLEWGNAATMGGLAWYERLLAALFHSITPRTAGFNTLSTGQLYAGTLFMTMMLMIIGGSPNSTAGGIKTTTFGVLLSSVVATVSGKSQVEMHERRLPKEIVDKALAVTVLSLVVVATGILLLMVTEQAEPMRVAFEAVSAFATVGLSTGITSDLSVSGRLVTIVLMFVGRLGPITLALAIGARPKSGARLQWPEERVIIG